jgi:carboxymethylenebutenolidase
MKALVATIGLAALVASAVAAPAEAAGRISFTQGSTKVEGYLALPNGEGTHPAVIVVQEWWGVNDWVENQTKKLADLGYIALAVDLYKGKIAKDQATAHQLANGLDETDAMNMLHSAADFLRGRSDVRANAIGVIGWCMGGGYAARLAATDPGIRTVVMYYGAPLTDEREIRELQAAVLGNFGGADKGIPPEKVRAFEKALKKAGKKVDFKVYPGAGHAFANETNVMGTYQEAAAKDAWARTTAFLKKELKEGSLPKRRS